MTLFAAFLAGFAALTLEILGVHWLAPWFGTSALVWSNQIGVVLLALALGGWLGGQAARRHPAPVRLAGTLLLGAGLLVAAGMFLLPWFAGWLLPQDLRLEEAAAVFLGGSLSSALLFFAPPVLLLAMVAPLLVEARAGGRGAGRAAGELSAVGSQGALAGVFGTSLLAIPFLGTRTTLAMTAVALLLAGFVLTRAPLKAAPLLVAGLLPGFVSDPAVHANLAPRGGQLPRVLEIRETPYQRLRVIEYADGERWLQMNEGLDSYQSVWRPDMIWPGGYYDLFLLGPLYAMEGAPADREAVVWSLGFGSGAAFGPISLGFGARPWRAVGVELDPAVVELAEAHMPLPPALAGRIEVHAGADARSLLRAAPADLDLVLLDAYARQFEIPPHLATEEFFAEVHGKLRDGGVLAINLGSSERVSGSSRLVSSLRAGLASAFGAEIRAHRVPFSRNLMLFARRGRSLLHPKEIRNLMPDGVPIEVGAACLPGQILDGPPDEGAVPFRDDRNRLTLEQARLWMSADEGTQP